MHSTKSNELVESFELVQATEEDMHLPAYDHTHLSSINTCPTWGIVRRSMRLKMPGSARAMALEAGSAAHDAFAAVKLYQYMYVQAKGGKELLIADWNGLRLFGAERLSHLMDSVSKTATTRTNLISFALEALYTSGFYDDPMDKKRTVTKISEALIVYIDRWDLERYPIWVADKTDPKSLIGVEIPVNMKLTIKPTMTGPDMVIRYTGRLDGLLLDDNKPFVVDDKTGARIDDAWLAQWLLSHQITGYCLCAGVLVKEPVYDAHVIGMSIPAAKEIVMTVRQENVKRNTRMFKDWANWVHHTVKMDEEFKDRPETAPMYTHSCNRYFHPCSLLPFCSEDEEGRKQMLTELEHDPWDVLDD